MFPGTVAENLALVATLGGESTAALVSARIAEIMRLVELGAELEDRVAADLSGGEKQRVALARALMTCGFNRSAQHMLGLGDATASACQIGTNHK